ncbi:hypothetical protein FRC02_003286 [Tulasnella sp. 418]|nr:hypothetical protein FRC02_003286 [Tulasnella sp. 418]
MSEDEFDGEHDHPQPIFLGETWDPEWGLGEHPPHDFFDFDMIPEGFQRRVRDPEEIDDGRLRFPHVFIDHVEGDHESSFGIVDHAWTIPEQRMFRLSASLRAKPDWWTKYKNPEIRSKWKSEALEQNVLDGHLTEREVDYVLDELDGYARLRDEETGAQVSCFDRIWQSDSLISDDLRQELISEIAKLEDVPESQKDWHPRSDGLVLDLVHPSLYCLVYGRTKAYPGEGDKISRDPSELRVITGPDPSLAARSPGTIDAYSISEKFAWIPTDFDIAEGGANATAKSYINNLHPKHAGLYRALEKLIARFSHLYDRVLTDIHPQNPQRRRIHDTYEIQEHESLPDPEEFESEEAYDEAERIWSEARHIVLPTVPQAGYPGGLENRATNYTIQGASGIQIIVKLANIHLTPEKPEYGGGSWHVEGMANERIIASGIYYYSSENVTPSQLAFRESVKVEDWYEQNHKAGVQATWGLESGKPNSQDLGAVDTIEGRCIAFPNIYQHQVSPFKLVDPTKPGHRKIIALFLVDPLNRIPSTSTIPPQQESWMKSALHEASSETRLPKLPAEMLDLIARNVDTSMSEKDAKRYRLELMDERTVFIKQNDEKFFEVGFNMCEH